jgi:poly(glycerol-phosphate) alpha-glucosyltransferase
MKLGMLTASMSRQAGGLFWAIKSLAGSIHDAGCNLQVFAGEDQSSILDKSAWGEVPITVLPTRGPAAFGYQVGLNAALTTAELDVVHVHGLWMHPSVAAKGWGRQGKPYLISPHGMLDPWAVRNSSWKKRIAGLLYENAHLRGAACIHALCESEYASIRAYGLNNPVAVIPNGVDLPDSDTTLSAPEWAASLPADSKVLFFLSRLHPKKGLINLYTPGHKARVSPCLMPCPGIW